MNINGPKHAFQCQECKAYELAVDLVTVQSLYFVLDDLEQFGLSSFIHPDDEGAEPYAFTNARCAECGMEVGPAQCEHLAEILELEHVALNTWEDPS